MVAVDRDANLLDACLALETSSETYAKTGNGLDSSIWGSAAVLSRGSTLHTDDSITSGSILTIPCAYKMGQEPHYGVMYRVMGQPGTMASGFRS